MPVAIPSPPPSGIYVPVPTFFTTEPTIENPTPPLDLPTQLKHALHLARNGIRGLVLLGSSGEAIALSRAERTELIAYIREGFIKEDIQGYALIAGTTAQAVEEVLVQIDDAKKAGANCAMVLAPGYFAGGGGAKGIEYWYAAVANGSELPIMM